MCRVRAHRRIGRGEKKARDAEPGDLPLGDRDNMMFMGTSVAAGTGHAVVVATAMDTELGRIARLIEQAGEDTGTPLQQKLEAFGRISFGRRSASSRYYSGSVWLRQISWN